MSREPFSPRPTNSRWRSLLVGGGLAGLTILVPVLPFLFFGDALEAFVASWLTDSLSPATVAAIVVGVLASDVLLPVPSSMVNTWAGARLGVLGGTLAAWTGLTLGACGGFAVARTFGRALAERLVAPDDWQRLEKLATQRGSWVLVVTRSLPVLAEATVLLTGVVGLGWRRFLVPVALANLGLAAVYAVYGAWAAAEAQLPVALVAAVVVPLAATFWARRWWPTECDSSTASPIRASDGA